MSKRLLNGHDVEQVGEEQLKDLGYDIFPHGMVRILPEGWLYPSSATTFLDKIYNMEVSYAHPQFLLYTSICLSPSQRLLKQTRHVSSITVNQICVTLLILCLSLPSLHTVSGRRHPADDLPKVRHHLDG